MTVTPGFEGSYPGDEAARAQEREQLSHLDVDGLALALSHAVETGELVRAAAAQDLLRGTVKPADKIFGDYKIPDSWSSEK
jgi:hypothetical protein